MSNHTDLGDIFDYDGVVLLLLDVVLFVKLFIVAATETNRDGWLAWRTDVFVFLLRASMSFRFEIAAFGRKQSRLGVARVEHVAVALHALVDVLLHRHAHKEYRGLLYIIIHFASSLDDGR